MSLGDVLEAIRLLDHPEVDGEAVRRYFQRRDWREPAVTRVRGARGWTDFVSFHFPGARGRSSGGEAPTLGIVGRLGGVGARPGRLGLVSDADGALVAIATAMALARGEANGEKMPGDVLVRTHVCPRAPVVPHRPVPFMSSPVDMATMNRHEVSPDMEAILSVDATKGNRIVNARGIGITPTVKEGWILPVSEDLLDLVVYVTGRPPVVVPLSTQDVTPYGNGLYHINSIVQPATATTAPVVGVATLSVLPVPGCATGANQAVDLDEAVRFCLEVAKAYGEGQVRFFDPEEFQRLVGLYGSMRHLQTTGGEGSGPGSSREREDGT